MRFRWKLLILLLLIAVVPVTAMRTVGVRGVRRLARELVAQSRKNLIDGAKNRLRSTVEGYAQILSEGRAQLEMALLFQADAVERALAGNPKVGGRIYFASDFASGHGLPPDLVRAADYARKDSHGGTKLLEITRSAQAFKLAPGIRRTDVAADIERLAALTPVYRKLSQRLQDLVTWYCTGLQSGVYGVYPGHGHIAPDFDPRKQFWYTEAFKPNSPWTDQFVDPHTGRNMVALSVPVKGANGKIAGVTALIIPIGRLLARRLLLENIPPMTRSFIAYLATRPDTGKMGVRIMAREDIAAGKTPSWYSPPEADWLISGDENQFRAVLDDLSMRKSNIRRIKFQGCDCLWVYGPIQQQGFLVLITPYGEILQPARRSEAYIQSEIQNLLAITRYGIFGILLVVIVLALGFSRTVSRPMQILADGARRLAAGDFNTRVDISSRDEFGQMAQVFNRVVPRLEESYQMRKSLDLAMEIQQNLLPKSDPRIPGLDIAGQSLYCEETGGDYYDFLQFSANKAAKIGVVVGDVSGHGIPSALVMTTARALLHQRAGMAGSLDQIISDVNRQLTLDVEDSSQFMTLFYIEINVSEKKIHWVRAGHDPALLYDSQSDDFAELAGEGLPLGVCADSGYQQLERKISRGQIIAIGTDGIWEARDSAGNMFGKQRLQDIIRRRADRSAREILDAVMTAVANFRHPLKKREDDITLVVVKVGDDVPSRPVVLR